MTMALRWRSATIKFVNQDPLYTIHLRKSWLQKVVTEDGFQEQVEEKCEIHNHLHFDANGVNENNFCT